MTKTTTPLLKLSEKVLATVQHAYLYSTGDLVLVHELEHKKLGRQSYVTMHKWPGRADFEGRICLHYAGYLRLVLLSSAVSAHAPSVSQGSTATKDKGLVVGSARFQLGARFSDRVTIYELPGLLSGGLTVQPDYTWEEPKYERWGQMPVAAA